MPTAFYMVHTLIGHCCHELGGKSMSHLPSDGVHTPLRHGLEHRVAAVKKDWASQQQGPAPVPHKLEHVWTSALSDIGCFILPRPPLPGLLYCHSKGVLPLGPLLSNNRFPDGRQLIVIVIFIPGSLGPEMLLVRVYSLALLCLTGKDTEQGLAEDSREPHTTKEECTAEIRAGPSGHIHHHRDRGPETKTN